VRAAVYGLRNYNDDDGGSGIVAPVLKSQAEQNFRYNLTSTLEGRLRGWTALSITDFKILFLITNQFIQC